jgi:hypothetical protein
MTDGHTLTKAIITPASEYGPGVGTGVVEPSHIPSLANFKNTSMPVSLGKSMTVELGARPDYFTDRNIGSLRV